MRGCTHPEPTGCPYSLFSFSYSTLIFFFFRVGSCPFSPLAFVAQGAPEPRESFENALAQGGASTENQFPDSPEWWVPTKNHPPSSPYANFCADRETPLCRGRDCPPTALFLGHWCVWTEEAPLSRGRGCPPTALLLTGVFVGDMCLDMSEIFQGSRGEPWLV